MKKLICLFTIFSLTQFGCLSGDDDSGPSHQKYDFSKESRQNYSTALTPQQIQQDLQSIKTMFTLMNVEDQMFVPLAKSENSLAKIAEPECMNFNEMMKEELGEDSLSGEISMSWKQKNGKDMVICQNDANPYDKVDNSVLTMTVSAEEDSVKMSMKMSMLFKIIKSGDQITGMEMDLSAYMKATINKVFNMEVVMSGTMKGDMFSADEENMTGYLDVEFSLLDGRYRGKTKMSLDDSEGNSTIQSCEITHNNQKVGMLDFTSTPPVVKDAAGNII